jgi:hypothetical protein
MIANAPGLNLVAAVKAQTENVTVASTSIGDLADVMSGFSSRGPYRGGTLKPDISAPGDGVVSAGAGTGIGGFNFSGTSMAAPHVGGSLILLRELHPDWTAQELEAELMNTAYPNAKVTDFSTNNFGLAPISRQGAGRLAVDQAAASDTVILAGPIASLSYGEPAPSTTTTYSQTMTIENKGATMRTYSLSSEVRPDLTAGGGSNVLSDVASIPGVTLSFSKGGLPVNSVNVNPGQSVSVSVNMQINPTALLTYFGNPTPARWMKSFIDVSRINSLLRLDQNEIAGLVDVTESGTGTIFHVPFHALPRAASSISTGATVNQTTSTISNLSLVNSGTSKGTTELFNLGSIDPQDAPVLTGLNGVPTQSSAEFDIKYVAARYTPNVAGAFGAYGPAYQFAITTFGARPNPIDAEFDTYVDVNNDGKPDFVVFNTDPGNITGAGGTGGNCVFVYSLSAKSIVPVGPLQGDACVAGTDSNNNLVSYGVNADTQINSANLIETVPLTAFGLDGPAKIQYYTFSFSNLGVDESGVFSYGNAPVDVAPDKYATAFDPNKQLYTPAFQTVTTAASSASNDSVTTNTGATDLEVGTLSYYQNNNPANTEAQYVITRRGFQNLLFTYMRGVQAIPLVQELNHANLTAFRVGLLNYERSGVLTSGEYNLLQSLFQQTYANP